MNRAVEIFKAMLPGSITLGLGVMFYWIQMSKAYTREVPTDFGKLLFRIYVISPFVILFLIMLAIQFSKIESKKRNFIFPSMFAGLAMIGVSIAGISDVSALAMGGFNYVVCPPIVFLVGVIVLIAFRRS